MNGQTPAHRSTWLCPEPGSRERMLDMDARLQRPRALAFGVLALVLAGASFDLGAWPILLLVVTVAGFALVNRMQERLDRPEYAIAASWAFSQLAISVAIAMTGGAESYAVSWLIIPLITLPARFGVRGVVAGVAFTVSLFIASDLAAITGQSFPQAYAVIFPATAMVAVAALSVALLRSDVDHRNEAIIDGLTGMLNRRALDHRLEELSAQAALTGQPIAVIAADLDHFKRVNDEHGHATGDAVLVDVAYRLRKRLRAFDLTYRMGGEEFLIVLPGAPLSAATGIAEDLRASIAGEPIAGLDITMSFGVAGSGDGGFDGPAVIAAADAALYAATAAGRDRVFLDGAAVAAR